MWLGYISSVFIVLSSYLGVIAILSRYMILVYSKEKDLTSYQANNTSIQGKVVVGLYFFGGRVFLNYSFGIYVCICM